MWRHSLLASPLAAERARRQGGDEEATILNASIVNLGVIGVRFGEKRGNTRDEFTGEPDDSSPDRQDDQRSLEYVDGKNVGKTGAGSQGQRGDCNRDHRHGQHNQQQRQDR
jgi:hypothetical protein